MLTFDKYIIKNRLGGGIYYTDNSNLKLIIEPGADLFISGEFNEKGERILQVMGSKRGYS